MNCQSFALARLPLLAILLLVAAGCSHRDPVTSLPALHGQSRAQVITQLGQPTRTEKFPMSKAADEFRIELQNTYPLSQPGNANVEIEELTWQDGDYWITLWLHQLNGEWVVLDACRWHKDILF